MQQKSISNSFRVDVLHDGETPSVYKLLPSVSEIHVGRVGAPDLEFVPASAAAAMWEDYEPDVEFVPVSVATDMWDDFIINPNSATNE